MHLKVYQDKSVLVNGASPEVTFHEGPMSLEAKANLKKIKLSFENGFLSKTIEDLQSGHSIVDVKKISDKGNESITNLVSSVTSEVGRALIGLSVMQCCIKSLAPNQSIRLHKGANSSSSFSWVSGLSMRTLDSKFVTPILRRFNLLKLNKDGFMMTRSLAENYPYTSLYKANMRGAKVDWLNLVEELELNSSEPLESLKLLLSLLINEADSFTEQAEILTRNVDNLKGSILNRRDVLNIMHNHLNASEYRARIFEISMHSLLYTSIQSGCWGASEINPLTQMRSANKKHGNIGDVEIVEDDQIIEAWDAKLGKNDLREEVEEIIEKITHHKNVNKIGFVTNVTMLNESELNARISQVNELYGVNLQILMFEQWVDYIYDFSIKDAFISEEDLSFFWIKNYTKYITQNNRDVAPIDEPCISWIMSLIKVTS